LLVVAAGFGASEAAGLTQVSEFVATILRIKTPEGTLVIKCGDPNVKVQLDGRDVVIAGSGLQEVRLRTGTHKLAVLKDGKPVREDLVSVARGGKEIVNVALEATASAPVAEMKSSGDMLAPPSHANQCLICHTSLHEMRADQALPSGHPPLDLAFFVQPARIPVQLDRRISANVLLDVRAAVKPNSIRSRGVVWSLAFAPDGRQLVIGQQGSNGGVSTVRLWDLAKGREVTLFQHPEFTGYRSLAFSPDGQNLAVGNFDGSLAVVHSSGWVPYFEANNASPINAVAFLPKSAIVAVGGWDGQVKFYHPTAKIESHVEYPGRIFAIAVSPDGSTLAVGGEGKMIQLYDIATFRKKATFNGHTHSVESLDFSPDGKLLASAGGFTVRVWDVTNGKAAVAHLHHSPEVLCVRFSPDGKLLAISDGDPSLTHDKVLDTAIVLFAASDWKVVRELRGHKNSIRALAFSPDGEIVASGSMDQTVKLWDCETGELRQTIVPGDSGQDAAKPAGAPDKPQPTER
jgi:hypothetical protein